MVYLLAPLVLGIVGGVLFGVLRRARHPRLDRRSALLTALAAGVAALVIIVARGGAAVATYAISISAFPWEGYDMVRYLLPLVLGILVILVLAIPPRRERAGGARLTRRTWSSFVGRPWIITLLLVLGIVLAVTVATGLASSRDEEGHYTQYVLDAGFGALEVPFYGWHTSAGPLVALVVLLVATFLAWSAIARPPYSEDLEGDVARRRQRSTNVARVAAGAMLLHLSTVLGSVAQIASGSLFSFDEDGNRFDAWMPFASLSTALQAGCLLAGAIGLGLWVVTALTAVGSSVPSASEKVSA